MTPWDEGMRRVRARRFARRPLYWPQLAWPQLALRVERQLGQVYLWQGDLAEFKERDTKRWTEYHEIETFTKEMPDGKTFWGIKLDKPCKHLIETAPGEFGCAIYDRRPYVCRIYAGINPDGPQPGCGFNRKP